MRLMNKYNNIEKVSQTIFRSPFWFKSILFDLLRWADRKCTKNDIFALDVDYS